MGTCTVQHASLRGDSLLTRVGAHLRKRFRTCRCTTKAKSLNLRGLLFSSGNAQAIVNPELAKTPIVQSLIKY